MKKRNLFSIILVVCVMMFSACSDDDSSEMQEITTTITFENISLPEAGYVDSLKYQSADLNFYNHLSYFTGGYSWEGFAYSKLTDKTTPGFANQYSTYGNGGANGSKIFAIAYAGFNEPTHFKFARGAYQLKSVMLVNSTFAALSIKEGSAYSKKFANGDWFKVTFTGYNANGQKEQSIDFYLADFRDGKSYICEQWTSVDLTSLGKVNKVEITFTSTDEGEFGINTPAYVCLDNLTYVNE